MRVAIAQLDYRVADFDGNLARVEAAVARARDAGADLVVLTELATCGYPPVDLLLRRHFVDANLRLRDRIASLSSDALAILVGYADRSTTTGGRPLHNAAALCVGGRVVDRAVKTLLPTYDVFDEDRWFEPALEQRPLSIHGVPVGVSICEDLWFEHEAPRRLYDVDPVDNLAAAGARLHVNLSASPFRRGKPEVRRRLVATKARRHGRWFVYANQVGGQDELLFDGLSLVADPAGRLVARGKAFAEDLVVVDVPADALGEAAPRVAPTVEEVTWYPEVAQVWDGLVLGVRDYLRKCGFRTAVVGLSGGIDSALTAAVAAEAVGGPNVHGVGMPGPYSSEGSVTDARALADNLGMPFQLLPIGGVYEAARRQLEPALRGLPEDVTEENLQARIRGMTLMALSNKHGHLLLTTGNKSEMAVGYCTLYGDLCGGLAVLSDVPKTVVYELAAHANRAREVIPRATIDKPPSAELRADQTDQDSLPPYEDLDRIIEGWVEEHWSVDEIAARTGIDRSVVATWTRRIDLAEYKRRQMPPGLRVTKKAFGTGRRMPIAAHYGGGA
ncbi:MAG: NAD+ synthase [Sandaracinaceae bacterium]